MSGPSSAAGALPASGLPADVLDRFAPPLAPLTRCTACNGEVDAVAPEKGGRPATSGTTTAACVPGP